MRYGIIAVAVVLGTTACGEPAVDEVPRVAERASAPTEGDRVLDADLELTTNDVGATIMATGWVTGMPTPRGFFLRTGDNRMIFIESNANVATGDEVRVIGPLIELDSATFDAWRGLAFEAALDAAWQVEKTLYVSATRVSPIRLEG